LGNIKIVHPQKHSISYGNEHCYKQFIHSSIPDQFARCRQLEIITERKRSKTEIRYCNGCSKAKAVLL